MAIYYSDVSEACLSPYGVSLVLPVGGDKKGRKVPREPLVPAPMVIPKGRRSGNRLTLWQAQSLLADTPVISQDFVDLVQSPARSSNPFDMFNRK